jgi:methylenetetrahydrofolate reductase (NADPH)
MTRAVRASPLAGACRVAERESRAITALAQPASVEMTCHDNAHLDACRALLATGASVYVSYLPGQTWRETLLACAAVRASGLEPVPHLPVREFADQRELERFIADLVAQAGIRRVLLIAGDRADPRGPFANTLDVIGGSVLSRCGIRHVIVAGHPEGHPRIPADELRRVERRKVSCAADAGIELTFLTQFFFEASPFLNWVKQLRAQGLHSRVVAGLAGPAKLTTLLRYAARCGVGPSIRALGARPASFATLVGERGPEQILRAIARAMSAREIDSVGIHLYSFGGLSRTCSWVDAVARGRFVLDSDSGFRVAERNGV